MLFQREVLLFQPKRSTLSPLLIIDLTSERHTANLNYSEPYLVQRKLNEFMFELRIIGYPETDDILVDEALQKAPY
ncbi:unnamed protein product [Ambrosiozyma monospora]|uniref:Unnamed protein product n=1 Tax=Ambrosiozyma monospora TaxID=43982 RepID=A0A9W6Z5I6_AMBMO|nr:unnamed protein product [Ambrosiozyma monospora]